MRSIFKLIVFILLGAIVNVAVAWGCALWIPDSESSRTDALWPMPVDAGWSKIAAVHTDTTIGVTECNSYGDVTDGADRYALAMQYVLLAGWPYRSFYRSVEAVNFPGEDLGPLQLSPPETWREGIELPGQFQRFDRQFRRFLPIAPLWPGFAINTIFYTAILWLLFAAPFALRRRRRIKRGLCPACAYPIGSSEICTECGTPVSSRRDDGM